MDLREGLLRMPYFGDGRPGVDLFIFRERRGAPFEKHCSRGTMVQYGCKAAADLVRLLQIDKAGGGLDLSVYRTKLLAGHLRSNAQFCLRK